MVASDLVASATCAAEFLRERGFSAGAHRRTSPRQPVTAHPTDEQLGSEVHRSRITLACVDDRVLHVGASCRKQKFPLQRRLVHSLHRAESPGAMRCSEMEKCAAGRQQQKRGEGAVRLDLRLATFTVSDTRPVPTETASIHMSAAADPASVPVPSSSPP